MRVRPHIQQALPIKGPSETCRLVLAVATYVVKVNEVMVFNRKYNFLEIKKICHLSHGDTHVQAGWLAVR